MDKVIVITGASSGIGAAVAGLVGGQGASVVLGPDPAATFRSSASRRAVRAAYSASKHALMSLTANLRIDLRAEFPDIHVSSLIPGVVATDFGLHAKHGGPDSRALPFAQPVEEVAQVMADLIEHPRAEAYTRPFYQKQVAEYYGADDVATVESKPPFVRP